MEDEERLWGLTCGGVEEILFKKESLVPLLVLACWHLAFGKLVRNGAEQLSWKMGHGTVSWNLCHGTLVTFLEHSRLRIVERQLAGRNRVT